MSKTTAVVSAILLIVCLPAAGDPSVNVPIDHWSYRFIERCEAKGIIHGLGDGIKPFSRREMASALRGIDTARGELTVIERKELQLLKGEFASELNAGDETRRSDMGFRDRLTDPVPLLSYVFDGAALEADALARQQSDVLTGRERTGSERVYRNRLGGVVTGAVGEMLGFRIAFEQTREQGTREYRLREDVLERRLESTQLKGNRVDYHEGSAYVVMSLPFADLEFGKEEARWGPAPGDNLTLSNNAASFDMIRLRARYGIFKLVSIAGALRPCPDRPDAPLCTGVGDTSDTYVVNGQTRALDREKYLAAHRVEAAVASWLDVGFHEALVYGDRGPSITYLNPLMFYWAAQSYQGHKDNLMMGVDVDVHPGNGLRAYFAYVADDLKKLRIFSNDFVNKFSLQAGFLWADPIGVDDVDLRGEYVRIEPWIFTHKFPINTFRHFDAPLGHALGPNGDRWSLSLGRKFSRDLEVILEFGRTRRGSNVLLDNDSIYNVGGDLHYGWRPGDERENKEFLAGNLHEWTRIGASVSHRLVPRLHLNVGYHFEWGDNVPLPPRDGEATPLQSRTGYGDGRQGEFALDLRYGYL